MLVISDLFFSYGENCIFSGGTFSIASGEKVALLGVSGSGKTTLFKLITGLVQPQGGKICIEGKLHNSDKVTYLSQENLLLPWRNVLDNVLLIYELGKSQKFSLNADNKKQALDMLARVGLNGFEKLFPQELSGGMRQRVALARALLQKRPLLLLDEPFGSLDLIIREELYTLIQQMAQSFHCTILFITHDFRDAFCLADRLLVLSDKKISHSFSLKNLNTKEKEDLIQKLRYLLSTEATLLPPLPSQGGQKDPGFYFQ